MVLNESYAQRRAQILILDPLPLVAKVFNMVIQEEYQRSIQHSLFSSAAPFLTDPYSSDAIVAAYVSNSGISKLDNLFCIHCQRKGHTKYHCYKHHGFPPNYKGCNSRSVHSGYVHSKPSIVVCSSDEKMKNLLRWICSYSVGS